MAWWQRIIWLCAGLTLTTGCITSRVTLPRLLPLEPSVAAADLAGRIAYLQQARVIRAAVQLQFTDYRDSGRGIGKAYPSASGALVLRRPESIRLQVQASLLGPLADMTSDGERFTVAVFYPTDRQSFIRGSNHKTYRLAMSNPERQSETSQQDISVFASLRPQHLSTPLLPPPVPPETPEVSWSVFETRRDEMDSNGSRPGWVTRTYYLLYVAQRNEAGVWRPRFAYWFDRTRTGTPLTRLEVFEDNGTLSTVSEFGGYAGPDGAMRLLPEWVRILRPAEGYALRVAFQSPEVNPELLPDDVFVLMNDRNLKVVDLDAQP
ncbi:hypothetical protein J8C06_06130 [Chloracidobacterium validum]|uniref:DUF4292 domain-containing protein n=1 Tax=Chloracidobacterium validum TaxID=2821543 RepID=A0ABX8B7C3_9BACT|nr:hypothetical protein [Chloracidobacterium validum]QUW01956.1 hypothetical protein J8C06_06130 [Chloracidobacterium validum]